MAARGRGARSTRSRWPRRIGAVAAIAVVAFLYWRPIRSYVRTKGELAQRRLEVAELASANRSLRRQLAGTAGDAALVRSARRLGFVRPGERLYIVKGIDAWQRAHGLAPRAAR